MQSLEEFHHARKLAKQTDSTKTITLRGSGITQRTLTRDAVAASRIFEKGSLAAKEAERAENEQAQAIEETMRQIGDASKTVLEHDQSQEDALAAVLSNRCSIVIGAAGTGKTTLLRRILQHLLDDAKRDFASAEAATQSLDDIAPDARENVLSAMGKVYLCSFTGRATQQMRRVLPKEFSSNVATIHAMLGFHPEDVELERNDPFKRGGDKIHTTSRRFVPLFDATNKLPARWIICDEASMVPIPLWNQIIEAVPTDCRFLLIGDIHQLPPVTGRSMLGFAMAKWPVYELTTIHRQARNSPIIRNAHHILKGEFVSNESHFTLIGTTNGAKDRAGKALKLPASGDRMAQFFLRQMVALHKAGIYEPLRDTIIVPKKTPNSPLSTHNLNKYLCALFNPPRYAPGRNNIILNPRTPIHTGTEVVHFAVGDKVLIINNINEHQPPITNGQMGVVERLSLNAGYDHSRGGRLFGASSAAAEVTPDVPDELQENGIDAGAALSELLEDFEDNAEALADDAPDDTPDDQKQSSHCMTVRFDNGDEFVASTSGDYSKIRYGYAITCHKSQGGEYPNVFIVAHSSDVAGRLLTREWLYTAVTRAKENVFLFADNKGLSRCLTEQKIVGQTLQEKIESFRAITGSSALSSYVAQPNLPDNVMLSPR